MLLTPEGKKARNSLLEKGITKLDSIAEKTGLLDPFPEIKGKEDEVEDLPPSVKEEMDTIKREEEEYQMLKAQVKIPYLPDIKKGFEYTLVLDLDETLIHFDCEEEGEEDEEAEDEKGYYLIRPGAIKFLSELSKYYELVIFTAAMSDVTNYTS